MKFIIRERTGNGYFAEPGFGLTSRRKAHVFDTDRVTLHKGVYLTHISYKQEVQHPSHTNFSREYYVIIPVGDL